MQYSPRRDKIKKPKEDVSDFDFGHVKHISRPKKTENKILVLDYLAEGKGFSQTNRRESIIQGIGTKWFSLLEVSLHKRGNYSQFSELVLPKKTEEEQKTPVKKVLRQLSVYDLTNTAYEALEEAINRIIAKNEKRFVAFFNKAQPITNRIHALNLIPGIGKKLMWDILEARKKLPFVSFQDIEARVKVTDINKMIQKRIIQELEGEEKHLLFTAKVEESNSKNRKRR
ncbi:MAG: DUF655 domain-containing protein [Candidatus Heimdallarchaeaceae archaeon]